jgi:hypothetical protein
VVPGGVRRAYLRVRDTLAGVISDIAESLSGVRIVASYNRQRNNVVHHRNVLGAYRTPTSRRPA